MRSTGWTSPRRTSSPAPRAPVLEESLLSTGHSTGSARSSGSNRQHLITAGDVGHHDVGGMDNPQPLRPSGSSEPAVRDGRRPGCSTACYAYLVSREITQREL